MAYPRQCLSVERPPRPPTGSLCETGVLNITFKLLDITPDGLDRSFRQHVETLLEVTPHAFHGAMRPGCVVLSVDIWYNTPEDLQRTRAAFQQRLLTATGNPGAQVIWKECDTNIFFPDSEHMVRQGQVVASRPRCDTISIKSAGPVVNNPGSDLVHVVLAGTRGKDFRLVCRLKGKFYDIHIEEEVELPDGSLRCTVLKKSEEK
uniref:Uncharacterized protein n=1 Tax=Tetraselmis chuii TaxID=63592 RepID=A0A7S1SWL5_9CHLO|mmetsp:Transcript_32832/g.58849  ORF Transcript_32832/g.58849 Transcript_32832/m.58849 type:complete len:205 (+) Transcript_32832:267-881(+)